MTTNNKISEVLSAQDKASIIAKIIEIKSQLPFLVNLTTTERQNLRKMGNKSVAYVQACLRGGQTFPDVLPPTINIKEFANDIALYNDLSDILVSLKALCEGMEDSIMAAGSDAMITADLVYGYLKQGSKQDANLKAHIEQIGERFKRQGKVVKPA